MDSHIAFCLNAGWLAQWAAAGLSAWQDFLEEG